MPEVRGSPSEGGHPVRWAGTADGGPGVIGLRDASPGSIEWGMLRPALPLQVVFP
jgi:hypothetical protein